MHMCLAWFPLRNEISQNKWLLLVAGGHWYKVAGLLSKQVLNAVMCLECSGSSFYKNY